MDSRPLWLRLNEAATLALLGASVGLGIPWTIDACGPTPQVPYPYAPYAIGLGLVSSVLLLIRALRTRSAPTR